MIDNLDHFAKEYAFTQTLKASSLNPTVRNARIAAFKAGAEWATQQNKKEIERLTAYIDDLSKGYEH